MMRSGICGSGQFRRRDLSTCLSSMGTRVLLVMWWQNRRAIVNVGVVAADRINGSTALCMEQKSNKWWCTGSNPYAH